MSTSDFDTLVADTAAYMTTQYPDYAILAGRIAVSNLHKETEGAFSDVIHDLYHWPRPRSLRRYTHS